MKKHDPSDPSHMKPNRRLFVHHCYVTKPNYVAKPNALYLIRAGGYMRGRYLLSRLFQTDILTDTCDDGRYRYEPSTRDIFDGVLLALGRNIFGD
jgi:hypothetical protein